MRSFLVVCFWLSVLVGSLAMGSGSSFAVQTETPLYAYFTGFESDELPPFIQGPLPQNGWTAAGTAAITAADAFSGAQSLSISPQTTVDKPLDASGEAVIWLEGWYMTTPEPEFPVLTELEPGSSLVLFHSIDGISCLDGDGVGGGTWKTTGITVKPTEWYRVTIRQDYQNHVWDCFVNGEFKLGNLHFKDNIDKLSGFRLQQGQNSVGLLDEFAVQAATMIPPFSTNDAFRFSKNWMMMLSETPYAGFNETEFNLFNRVRDDVIDARDLTELLKGWHWEK